MEQSENRTFKQTPSSPKLNTEIICPVRIFILILHFNYDKHSTKYLVVDFLQSRREELTVCTTTKYIACFLQAFFMPKNEENQYIPHL